MNDAGAFREWLFMLHDEEYKFDLCEGYGCSTISKYAGVLTYRYIKLFCDSAGVSVPRDTDSLSKLKLNLYLT